jgi:hypothetical protein
LLLENLETSQDDCVIDSKDAKAIVCGDIQPVQNPGKSWKSITYEDHTFEQSRVNAVYPMTHLFMEPKESIDEKTNTARVTRTGQAVVLINIAFFEPETTFRAMNEILYLLSRPSLDKIFRNPVTGNIKSVFSFIVDNGHGEDPDSPLTQMCLSRLLYLLSLTKISQRSFAEYHSKRNFVERVHAAENLALSRHGSFNTKKIHSDPEVGSKEHAENMEEMALDVKDCISEARFAGRFLQCFRGISNNNGVFDDENKLKEFLSLSEERKEECTWTYKAESISNSIFESLVMVWNVPADFERRYISDYNVVMNKEENVNCSAWKDKYSTTLYSGIDENNFEFQPIPDYVRWFESNGELHYLSYEKTVALYEEIQIDIPALLLPSTVLDWLFVKNSTPPDDVLFEISILAWLPVQDVTKYFQLKRDKMEKDFKKDLARETWRNHTLYKKSTGELQQQCRKDSLSPSGQKYELVQRLALARGEQDRSKFQPSYCGKLSSLPKSLSELKKMPIPTIKYILKSNAISYAGNKDELVL